MKTVVFLALALFASCTLAQLYVGTAWQGTWSDGKRNGGGSTFICVDTLTQTAYGTYSGIGLFSGYLWGNTLTGFWYEAGYDRPFGPFQLTISGSSFSGTWSYYESDGVIGNTTFTWSGSRSSNERPLRSQCLAPSGSGKGAAGTYEPGNYLCHNPHIVFGNTNQQSVWGAFAQFGNVAGYTPDNGVSFLLSDFYYPDDNDDNIASYRPEGNNTSTFGPCASCFDDDGDTGNDPNVIPTKRIVVGRLINDSEFCGFFWQGLYNYAVSSQAICLQRTSSISPDRVDCGGDIVYVNAQIDRMDTGITSWILSQIQSAFDALVLPPVVIIPNDLIPNDDDEEPTNSDTTIDGTNTETTIDGTNSNGSNNDSNGNGGDSGADSNNSSLLVASTFLIAVLAVF